MTCSNFKILSLNTRRIERIDKLTNIKHFCELYSPQIICFQEINIVTALRIFSAQYQVFVNYSNNFIGTVTVVKKGIKVLDFILCETGRIIGIKLSNVQVWNIYAASGSHNKKAREIFFRETLPNLMTVWQGFNQHVLQLGDHNCTHRIEDSENIERQKSHVQAGLIAQLELFSLKDELLRKKGKHVNGIYSRVTNVSKTRIDFIFSNSEKCIDFKYIDTDLLNLDHKAIFAEYDVNIGYEQSARIPKERYFSGWVISKKLENDNIFLNEVRDIFDELIKYSRDLENKSVTIDWTYIWLVGKFQLIDVAKKRESQIYKDENDRKKTLQIFLNALLNKIATGQNRWEEYENVKRELSKLNSKASEEAIDHFKFVHIEDHLYDLQKLKNQKQYENKGKINKIIIDGKSFAGTESVVEGIKDKLKVDISDNTGIDWNEPATGEESLFLGKVWKADLSDEEIGQLLAPVSKEDIKRILCEDVDLDSSPGEDGITYRILKKLIDFPSFSKCIVNMLDHIRHFKNMGALENNGIMKLLNKKLPSDEYIKKRKLTMVNKSENSLSGMIWTQRLKKYILPKVLPNFQYICQGKVNITDENRELRNIVNYLRSTNQDQLDGTLLAIDFKDAFRSTNLRWCNLVMKAMNIPEDFIGWLWAMYDKLSISVVINKWISDKIPVKRGFMEGHSPSMGAFVLAIAPLGHALEDALEGITTSDGIKHRVKAFADDAKLVIKNIDSEITMVYEVINRFEKVSGMEMHRDRKREKCQALPFGSHRSYTNWPDWITVKNEVKILGINYSNFETLEVCNSRMVLTTVNNILMGNFGIRGTPMQKISYINTNIYSKIWYIAQSIKLEARIMKEITQKALNFIWAGQNERPVRALNFRSKEIGGLGLVCPEIKGKALMIKSMFKDFKNYNYDHSQMLNLYGYINEFKSVINADIDPTDVKQIYNYLMVGTCFKNGSVIPSREEKRSKGVKWKNAWLNLKTTKKISAPEKYFQWQVQQDMLPVGKRIHRHGAEKRCLKNTDVLVCMEVQSLTHALLKCPCTQDGSAYLRYILELYLGHKITDAELLHFSFNHRNKKRLKCALWLAVKMFYLIFSSKSLNKNLLRDEMLKEVQWNLNMMWRVGSSSEMIRLQTCILTAT